MDEGLPTFFTSNFTMEELEKHFSCTNNSIDKVKANGLLIIVYILAIVEFVQVIYLYVKLEKTKKEFESGEYI